MDSIIIAVQKFIFLHAFLSLCSLQANSLGHLAKGPEKERELATTPLEFEYLH